MHNDSCQFLGLQGKQFCNCPTRLSAGTVDSLRGKLRSIFIALGRTGNWDDRFGFGNPTSHVSVKQYLKSIQSEQSQARVSPKQATPVFFDKYRKIVYHLRNLLLIKQRHFPFITLHLRSRSSVFLARFFLLRQFIRPWQN